MRNLENSRKLQRSFSTTSFSELVVEHCRTPFIFLQGRDVIVYAHFFLSLFIYLNVLVTRVWKDFEASCGDF